jgi:hypothetical protein
VHWLPARHVDWIPTEADIPAIHDGVKSRCPELSSDFALFPDSGIATGGTLRDSVYAEVASFLDGTRLNRTDRIELLRR